MDHKIVQLEEVGFSSSVLEDDLMDTAEIHITILKSVNTKQWSLIFIENENDHLICNQNNDWVVMQLWICYFYK